MGRSAGECEGPAEARVPVARDHGSMARRPSRTPGPEGRSGVPRWAPFLLVVASGAFAMTLFVSLLGLFNQ